MGIIYKITNTINNKVYIGKTCRNLQDRWREHKNRVNNKKYNSYLYNAMRKYGIKNFIIEEIEKCNEDIINDREQFYISFFKSNNKKYGYNLTNGGDGYLKYDYLLIRQLWDEGKSCSEIKKFLKCDKAVITQALQDYENYSFHESLSRRNRKGVNQYDLNGNFINHYNSIIEASNFDVNIASGISACCRKKIKQSNNYIWTYDYEQPPKKVKIKKSKRKILQYDLNENFIKSFESAASAAREVSPNQNCNTVGSQILQVCKGNRKTAKGFIWKYGD